MYQRPRISVGKAKVVRKANVRGSRQAGKMRIGGKV